MAYSNWNGGKVLWICSIFYFCSITQVEGQFVPEDLIMDGGPLGTLKGGKLVTVPHAREYIRFAGIPYAKAPVESSRFLPAEPADVPLKPAGEIFDASKTTACCPQPSAYAMCAFSQKEDCLGMSVFTPVPPRLSTKLLPVIVFIHGGGFTMGSDNVYNGNRLLDERDVILVTFNYRLGALGFFCLNTEDAPGNAAMYDMREALIWIKTYIQYFGGDPERITITGQSAGSAAVSHLMTSPLTRNAGLFHRAIAMSGTVLNEWGTTTSEKAEKSSLEIAEMVGCYDSNDPIYDPAAVVRCMHNVPVKDLVTKLDEYQVKENNNGRLGFEPVTPVVQKVGPGGGDMFLPENPEGILERHEEANVPLITGSTRHDGSFVLGLVYGRYLKFNGYVEDDVFLRTKMVPALLSSLGIQDKTGAVFDALASTFLGEVKNSGNLTVMLPGLTDLFTVFFFKAATFRTLKLHASRNPQSYWYNFDYRGRRSNYGLLIPDKTIPVQGGVAHSDDLIYLFTIPLQGLDQPEELAVSKRLVDYWVNFAYSGNPNAEDSSEEFMLAKRFPKADDKWQVFSEENPNFAILDTEDMFVGEYPNDYWLGATHELYPELNPPTTTTTETTTPATESTTPSGGDGEITVKSTTVGAGESTTVAAGESTTVAAGESTTVAAGESTTVAAGESTTPTGESSTGAEEPEKTTNNSPTSQTLSFVLLFAATATYLIQATRQPN